MSSYLYEEPPNNKAAGFFPLKAFLENHRVADALLGVAPSRPAD